MWEWLRRLDWAEVAFGVLLVVVIVVILVAMWWPLRTGTDRNRRLGRLRAEARGSELTPSPGDARGQHDHHTHDDNHDGDRGAEPPATEPADEAHQRGERPERAGEAIPAHQRQPVT